MLLLNMDSLIRSVKPWSRKPDKGWLAASLFTSPSPLTSSIKVSKAESESYTEVAQSAETPRADSNPTVCALWTIFNNRSSISSSANNINHFSVVLNTIKRRDNNTNTWHNFMTQFDIDICINNLDIKPKFWWNNYSGFRIEMVKWHDSLDLWLVTARKRSCGKVMSSPASVCSLGRGGKVGILHASWDR